VADPVQPSTLHLRRANRMLRQHVPVAVGVGAELAVAQIDELFTEIVRTGMLAQPTDVALLVLSGTPRGAAPVHCEIATA
jgi:hypothetical protein